MRPPDAQRLARNAADVYVGNGQPAIHRVYVSAAASTPKFGLGDRGCYNDIPFTGLFAYVTVDETQAGGGQINTRQLTVTTNRDIGGQDFVIYNGTAYRAEGNQIPSVVGGVVQQRIKLNLASQTGV